MGAWISDQEEQAQLSRQCFSYAGDDSPDLRLLATRPHDSRHWGGRGPCGVGHCGDEGRGARVLPTDDSYSTDTFKCLHLSPKDVRRWSLPIVFAVFRSYQHLWCTVAPGPGGRIQPGLGLWDLLGLPIAMAAGVSALWQIWVKRNLEDDSS